jgi:hypothetical protein
LSHSVRTDISAVLAMISAKESWRARMDLSADGVFRSFLAIPLSLPFFLLFDKALVRAVLAMPAEQRPDLIETPFLVGELIQMGIVVAIWLGSLWILALFAKRLHWGEHIAPVIIGFNWSVLIVQLPVSFLAVAMVSMDKLQGVVTAAFLGFILQLFFRFRVLHIGGALKTGTVLLTLIFLELFAIAVRLVSSGLLSSIFPVFEPAAA